MFNIVFVINFIWSGKFGVNYVNKGIEYVWVGDVEVNE